jgi:hypothetical protein
LGIVIDSFASTKRLRKAPAEDVEQAEIFHWNDNFSEMEPWNAAKNRHVFVAVCYEKTAKLLQQQP